MKKHLLDLRVLAIFILLQCLAIDISAQCFPDRHNLTIGNAWLGCEEALSPNLARGNSIWIMYDLGTEYELGPSHFWNINNFIHQNSGMRNVAIDVSSDGSSWREAAVFELQKGAVSGFYEGDEGPDLTGNNGRYVLITGLSNYGGDCMGLSEFKVAATPMTTGLNVLDLGAELIPTPNPFMDYSTVVIKLEKDGVYNYALRTLEGKTVDQGNLNITNGQARFEIPGDNLMAGTYLFSLTDGKSTSSVQLIKQ